MRKKLLFSLTKKDFEIQTFRAGGKGGQHQNKRETGVRIIHKTSGAYGEARDSRSQADNKKNAFQRLLASSKFKTWHNREVIMCLHKKEIEDAVEEAMKAHNIRVEGKDENGNWQTIEESV